MRTSIGKFGHTGLVALSLSCAGPQFSGGVFRDEDTAFRIGRLPPSYERLEVEGVDLAYRDSTSQATVAINARCGKDADDVPLTALTHHLFLHFTEREVLKQKEFTLDGRAALRTEMRAKLDGVTQHFAMVVLKKNGCVYDFMLVAHPNRAESNVASFDEFVTAFQTVGEFR